MNAYEEEYMFDLEEKVLRLESSLKEMATRLEESQAQNRAAVEALEEIKRVSDTEWLDRLATRHVRTLACQALSNSPVDLYRKEQAVIKAVILELSRDSTNDYWELQRTIANLQQARKEQGE